MAQPARVIARAELVFRRTQDRDEDWARRKVEAGYQAQRQRPGSKVCLHSRVYANEKSTKFYCKRMKGAPVAAGAICGLYEGKEAVPCSVQSTDL